MIFEQIAVGKMSNFSYLFADEISREGFLVDPAFDHEKLLEVIKKHSVNLTRIVLTHHHFDHVNAAGQVKARTGAEIVCHKETARLLQGETSEDRLVDEGDHFKIGAAEISILHVPGHAPGSICLIVDDKWLVTGDTLFIGDCGRSDLPGGNIETLYESLQKIKKLPDHLIVCSGHDYGPARSRTLGEEKRLNPVLLADSLKSFYKL